MNFIFSLGQPLIGAFGYAGDSLISGISFIQFDTSNQECKSLLSERKEDIVEDSGSSTELTGDIGEEKTNEATEKDKPLDIMTIGIYTGIVFVAILTILIIIMAIERCRMRRKNVTTVVELKPVDIEAHRRGIKEREAAAAKKNAAENTKAKGPARTPIII